MHRRRVLPAALIIWVVLLACNAPVATMPPAATAPPAAPPSGLPTPPPEPDFTPVAEATVGADGGTVEGGGLTLTIPPGALEADTAISLSTSEERPFGDEAASPVYRVKGLPAELGAPLTVRVQAEDPLSGDCFIAAGNPAFNVTAGFTTTVFAAFPATENAGYLEATLELSPGPVGQGASLAAPAPRAQKTDMQALLDVFALKAMMTYGTKHFNLAVPVTEYPHSVALGKYFEEAYDAFKELGFEYPQAGWPMHVLVMGFSRNATDIARYSTVNISGRTVPVLSIDRTYVNEEGLSRLPTAIGRAFFLAIADYYARGHLLDPNQLWLHIAAAVWAEEQFADDPQTYRPAMFQGYELAPLRGLRYGAGNNLDQALAHGRGMAALVKYAVDTQEPEVLVETYTKLREGESATEALLAAIGIPMRAWLPHFFAEYVGGNVYGVSAETFTRAGEGVFDVECRYATRSEYPGTFADLSAQVYIITVELTEKDVRLHLSVTSDQTAAGDLSVVVFRSQGGKLTPVGNGPSVSLRAAEAAGQLVAVVVNGTANPPDYTARTNAKLKLDYFGWGVNFKDASISLEKFETKCLGAYSAGGLFPCHVYPWTCRPGTGNFAGEEFSCSWDYEGDEGGHYFGSINITFAFNVDDPRKHKVAHFDAKAFSNSGTTEGSNIIAGTDVPLAWAEIKSGGGFHWEFAAFHQDACDRISPPLISEWKAYAGDDPNNWARLDSFSCTNESVLRIVLEEPTP